jgi:uncharacterized protein (DUF2252 family)
MSSPPTTPQRKRKRTVSTSEESPSPRKTRTPRTPGTPTKTELKKAEAAAAKALKAQRKDEWATWCSEHEWTRDPGYRQKVGTWEIHRVEGMLKLNGVNKVAANNLAFSDELLSA